jgi:antagonist of KipI
MIEVLDAGTFTSVQDLGRAGWAAQGVPPGGAADPFALRVLNALLGNPEAAPGLECTLRGPVLRCLDDTVLAIGGATVAGWPALRRRRVAAGECLNLSRLSGGARAYVAFAGGLAVPSVLGSASLLPRSGWPGLAGRPLQAGDRLPCGPATAAVREDQPAPARPPWSWSATPALLPADLPAGGRREVRALPGPQAEWFGEEGLRAFFAAEFQVSPRSDRMGVRLEGAPVRLPSPRELISEAVAFGSVQVPPDGRPIVLLADRPTLGGYPKLAQVITADRGAVAQLRPGDRVRFVPVTLAEAHAALRRREAALAQLRQGVALADGRSC